MKINNMKYKKLGIIAGVVVVIGMMFYGLVYIPNQELQLKKDAQFQEKIKSITAQSKYNTCLDTAYENYVTNWNLNCSEKGLKENCTLYGNLANELDTDYSKTKKECLDEFEALNK